MKPNLLIDFDGVIHRYSKGVYNQKLYDIPVHGAKEFIDSVKDKYRIVVFTARLTSFDIMNASNRVSKEDIEEWMNKYNIYYDEVTGQKLPAVAYIDDMGIEFTGNWNNVKKRLSYLDQVSRWQININTWDEFENKVKQLRGE